MPCASWNLIGAVIILMFCKCLNRYSGFEWATIVKVNARIYLSNLGSTPLGAWLTELWIEKFVWDPTQNTPLGAAKLNQWSVSNWPEWHNQTHCCPGWTRERINDLPLKPEWHDYSYCYSMSVSYRTVSSPAFRKADSKWVIYRLVAKMYILMIITWQQIYCGFLFKQ